MRKNLPQAQAIVLDEIKEVQYKYCLTLNIIVREILKWVRVYVDLMIIHLNPYWNQYIRN